MLEDVFEPLRQSALGYDRPWSVSELRLTNADVAWLRSWFSALTPQSTENWIKSVMFAKLGGKAYATYRQMFGAILVCLSSEVCREESKEDSVWPTIRSLLPDSHALRRELFVTNGQPSGLTKDLITDAVRALNLRHVMDIEGTQQWFITIKMQYGFTRRGAANRLAEWLVNLGRPHAIQYLIGRSDYPGVASESFQSLWRALTQYRRGLLGEDQIRSTLQQSPWVHAGWIDELLREARARIESLGTGDWQRTDQEDVQEGNTQGEFCPVSNVSLEWPVGSIPRLRIDLDRGAIHDETADQNVSELDVYVDGNKLTRWLRQPDGNWTGQEFLYVEQDAKTKLPNLRPRVLALRSRSGDTIAECDLTDFGLAEQILLFDLDSSRSINVGMERLEPSRRYAIVCERSCQIQGCEPAEIFERAGLVQKAARLPVPLGDNICVTYGDYVLWQPVGAGGSPAQKPAIVLTTPRGTVFAINARTPLVLEGIPTEVNAVQLLIHTKTYEVRRASTGWETIDAVTLTPELVSRERRVRVRIHFDGKAQSHEPRLSFCLLSAGVLRRTQEQNVSSYRIEPLKPDTDLNRSEGTALLRVWAPLDENSVTLLEGDCIVGKVRHGKIPLREIPGNGGLLNVLMADKRHSFDVSCVDIGCISGFRPAILGNPALLSLSDPKDPKEVGPSGYTLWQWEADSKARLRALPSDSIQKGSTENCWTVRITGLPLAIALTWKGCWLGVWWDLNQISSYIGGKPELTESDFAILKWLRVPLLKPLIEGVIAQKVKQVPCRFMRSWLKDAAIPDGLHPHKNVEGIDSVARHFLWSEFSISHAREGIQVLTDWDGNLSHPDRYVAHLDRLCGVSPLLMWKGLERFLNQDPGNTLELIRAFTCMRLGLAPNARAPKVRERLGWLETRTVQATSINGDRVSDLVNQWVEMMHKNLWQPPYDARTDLIRIGQTLSGRHFVSTSIARYWLKLSGDKEI